MPIKFGILPGDKIIVRDGLNEWMKTYEGVVTKVAQISGTPYYRISMDPPCYFDVERD